VCVCHPEHFGQLYTCDIFMNISPEVPLLVFCPFILGHLEVTKTTELSGASKGREPVQHSEKVKESYFID